MANSETPAPIELGHVPYIMRVCIIGQDDSQSVDAIKKAIDALIDLSESTGDAQTPVRWRIVTTLVRRVEQLGVRHFLAAVEARARDKHTVALEIIAPYVIADYLAALEAEGDKSDWIADVKALIAKADRRVLQIGSDGTAMEVGKKVADLQGRSPDPDDRGRQHHRAICRAIDTAEIALIVWDEAASQEALEPTLQYALENDRVVLAIDPRQPSPPIKRVSLRAPHKSSWRLLPSVLGVDQAAAWFGMIRRGLGKPRRDARDAERVQNAPPVFDSIPSAAIEIEAGKLVTFVVQASDPDPGDPVTLVVVDPPPGMTTAEAAKDPESRANAVALRVRFTPSAEQAGRPWKVHFRATDGRGLATEAAVTLGPRTVETYRLKVTPLVAPKARLRLVDISAGYREVVAYNHDLPPEVALIEEEEFQKARGGFRGELNKAADGLDDAERIAIKEALLPPIIVPVLRHFVRADQLAIHYQKKHTDVSIWLYRLAAGAVTVAIFQKVYFPDRNLILLGELVLLLGIIYCYRKSRHAGWHPKWLNYRYLAESLRQAAYSATLGDVPRDDPRYDMSETKFQTIFSFYKGPQTWLLDYPRMLERLAAMRLGDLEGPRVPEGEASADATPAVGIPPQVWVKTLRSFLLSGWIKDQLSYHRRQGEKRERLEEIYHRRGMIFFSITCVVALLHSFEVGEPLKSPPRIPPHLYQVYLHLPDVFTFLAVVLPAWGSAFQAIKTQHEFRRMAVRHERMRRVLQVLAERFQDATSLPELHKTVANARREMGIEYHEWWILLGFRDPALPA